MSNINRARGDTRRIQRTVTVGGVAQNITGWSFMLTVNEEANPTDTANQVAEMVGTITDAANGVVEFYPTIEDVATAGEYYYDIQVTDADGKTTTPWKGEFNLWQDITKSDLVYTWTPDSSVVDGTAVAVDGTADWYTISYFTSDDWTKETRDTLPVMRWAMDTAEDNTYNRAVYPYGADLAVPPTMHRGWEVECLFYANKALVDIYFMTPGWWDVLEAALDNRSGGDPTFTVFAAVQRNIEFPTTPSTTGWGSDWFRVGIKITADGELWFRAWVEGGTEGTWYQALAAYPWSAVMPFALEIGARYDNPQSVDAVFDLAEVTWTRL
jgi:hypothetical protein